MDEADSRTIAEAERAIQKGRAKVAKLEATILEDQEAFIAKKGEEIKVSENIINTNLNFLG